MRSSGPWVAVPASASLERPSVPVYLSRWPVPEMGQYSQRSLPAVVRSGMCPLARTTCAYTWASDGRGRSQRYVFECSRSDAKLYTRLGDHCKPPRRARSASLLLYHKRDTGSSAPLRHRVVRKAHATLFHIPHRRGLRREIASTR